MLFITLLAKPYVGWLFISWIYNLRHSSTSSSNISSGTQPFLNLMHSVFHTETFEALNTETSCVYKVSFF